jgi:hypothetical protein
LENSRVDESRGHRPGYSGWDTHGHMAQLTAMCGRMLRHVRVCVV